MENQDSSELTVNVNAADNAETHNHISNGYIVDQENGADQSQMERSLLEAVNMDGDSVTSEGSEVASPQIQQTRQLVSQREMTNLQSADLPGLQELVGSLQPRRNRINTSTLKNRYRVKLEEIQEKYSYLPKPGTRTLA